MDDASLEDLQQQRAQLYDVLAATGDFRRGSVSKNYRRLSDPRSRMMGQLEQMSEPIGHWQAAGADG